jgi:hypothetical protein
MSEGLIGLFLVVAGAAGTWRNWAGWAILAGIGGAMLTAAVMDALP